MIGEPAFGASDGDADRGIADHTPSGCVHRRSVLAMAATAIGAVSGCLGGDSGPEEPPEPIDLGGGKQCDVCGMVIGNHFGPNGQVFYAEGPPENRDGPTWFDSVRELFVDRFGAERRGHDPIATYVTDYSIVEYEIVEEGTSRYVSSHVESETFVDATDAVFVVDSDVMGAMGPDLHPFSDAADATAAIEPMGGRVVGYDDVTPELVADL
ncbi:MAG: nitrous oxide reductase accessory protein NosL [Halobacteriota archaeon]